MPVAVWFFGQVGVEGDTAEVAERFGEAGYFFGAVLAEVPVVCVWGEGGVAGDTGGRIKDIRECRAYRAILRFVMASGTLFDLRTQEMFAQRRGMPRRGLPLEGGGQELRLGEVGHRVAGRLFSRLGDLRQGFERVVDLGSCGDWWGEAGGWSGGRLPADLPESLFLRVSDSDLRVLQGVGGVGGDVGKDSETGCESDLQREAILKRIGGKVGGGDLVVSHLSLHMQNDIGRILALAHSLLAPGGLFLASVAGAGTLERLRGCFLRAEMGLYGGAGVHVVPLPEMADLGQLLQKAGFALPVLERDEFVESWGSSYELMRELRSMGVANSLSARRKTFTPRTLFAEVERLWKEEGKEEGQTGQKGQTGEKETSETFEVIYLTAWTPADDQQRPMRPGTAEQSLIATLDAKGEEESSP